MAIALAAIGLGLFLGGAVCAAVGSKIPAWPLTVVASALNVAGLMLLVQFYSVTYTIIMCFVFGVTSSAVGAAVGVVSLQATPESMRGRVNGLQNSIAMAVGPLGVFAMAWLISGSSVGVAGWLLAIFWLFVNMLVILDRSVRQAVKDSSEPK